MIENILVIYKKSTHELYAESPDQSTKEYARQHPELVESHAVHQHTLETVLRI